ncbi:beta-lactamase/transpeptidase-like protein [Aspergillus egyptiacus]|nr:beta-lactamase/transpeptidase-like protein [Aspergillus egyptiacus]
MSLPPATVDALTQRLSQSCEDPSTGLPGVSLSVIGKDGQEIFTHAAGQRGLGSPEPMTPDTVFWIASCTKMIVGIACMQLVEQGQISLDDADAVERLCPELKEVKVLQGDGTLVEKERGITLRMLLTHTAGFGYSFIHPILRDYSRPTGYNEFSGYLADFKQPLVHQPGEAWEYGVNIDWAGIVLERLTGQSLGAYIEEHIFQPLGLTQISMVPSDEMKAKLAYMHQRDPTGRVSQRDHLLQRALTVDNDSELSTYVMSGGAGCFSTATDYTRILAVLLNNGLSPNTGKQILLPETVESMFQDQIGHLPPLSEKYFADAKPDLHRAGTGIHPTVEGDRQGWGLTFMLSGGTTGRSRATAQWSGLPNLRWWCDREKGVAGIICVQVLPFGDAQLFQLSQDVEMLVYQGLEGL